MEHSLYSTLVNNMKNTKKILLILLMTSLAFPSLSYAGTIKGYCAKLNECGPVVSGCKPDPGGAYTYERVANKYHTCEADCNGPDCASTKNIVCKIKRIYTNPQCFNPGPLVSTESITVSACGGPF